MTNTKPTFKGSLLVETPETISQIGFLEGDFGQDFLQEYQGRVKADYAKAPVLDVLSYRDGVVKGSNPFAVVLANKILRKNGLRTASQADLEKALSFGVLPLRGTYEDPALVLRTRQDPNSYLAGNLFDQLKAQGKRLKKNSAYVLWLRDLSLKADRNSPNGLSFAIPSDFIDYFEAPILNQVSQQRFESSDIESKTGIPAKVSSTGSRILYTRNFAGYLVKNSGLVRSYLNGNLNLSSNDGDLTYSDVNGRVVVRTSEAGAPKIKGVKK